MKTILCNASGRYGVACAYSKLRGLAAAVLFTALAGVSVADAETLRITALGDSLTQGYGLVQGEGLVPQLEAWLRARGHDVSVINAGVSGDTTTGGRARLDWTLADNPDAVIVALGGNDLLRGIDPALSRANLDAILTRLDDEGLPALLVGLPAPGNYGAAYQQAFSAMYPELAEAHDALLVANMMAPLTAEGIEPRAVMQGDMIHPNPAGVLLVVEAMGPAVEELIARVAE
ncbi:arylesterase [Pararhodobacter zhoushanensis]|uniref:arylesterase n=1 Tax=Pararhodobacter zhoushanensis TaxID=2479545 RepID=UPI000F8C3955|nr:arylesterase [Pararhodobacter zhoushanensis]